jgi:dienelactone hydrolase
MFKKTFLAVVLLIFGILISEALAETVEFKGAGLTLTGKLSKPDGTGPFPAIVLLHAAMGITSSYDAWIERLSNWKYVTLLVDSFSPRGIKEETGYPFKISRQERIEDAYAAKSYLASLKYVDSQRIAVMGWSYGGVATILSVTTESGIKNQNDYFRAGIAFYPGCRQEVRATLKAPLLILIGEKDSWTPPSVCKKLEYTLNWDKKSHQLLFKIYPNTFHAFDMEGIDRKDRGHRLKYNRESASDAIQEVRSFLEKHMK